MLLVTFGLYMQIYATLPFSGCSLLKATEHFSSAPPPLILHFTRSSTHSNVHEGARLEGNWIKSNPPKLHGAWRKEHRSKRKGICYPTPALHLISPDCLETISHLGEGRTEDFGSAQTLWNLLWWCKFGQPSPCPHEMGFFSSTQSGRWGDRRNEHSGKEEERESCERRLGLNWYSSRGVGIFKCQ